jgi:hypothetical protein
MIRREMLASFDDVDFERAVAASVDVAAARRRLEAGGLDWDFLCYVGVGLATDLVPAGSASDRGAAADAFVAGFLIAVTLVAPVHADVSRAVDVVGARGRHSLIADYCDLAAAARFETTYAAALAEAVGLGAAEDALVRLFESGLATGFALGTPVEPASAA